MTRSFYARYAWPILIVAGIMLPVSIWGAIQTFRNSNNSVAEWLPQDFPETGKDQEFRRVFGADDFALRGCDGCKLGDERRARLAQELVPPPEKRREGDGTECFDSVMTGTRALAALMSPPFELSRKEALGRLKGTLIGSDLASTCALITLADTGDADREKSLDALIDIAVTRCGLSRDELRLGGDTVFNAAIDLESRRAVRTWLGLASGIALAIAWISLRRVRLILMVFVVAAYAAVIGTGMIHFTGGRMNLVMVVVPVLIYVLALSAAVHLVNYYRDALRESGPEGAPLRAMSAGWTPCALSAVTTAVGLGSLYVSHVIPVKMFGVYSAVGVLLSLTVLFLLLPALMELWPLRDGLAKTGSRKSRSAVRRDRFLGSLAAAIIRRKGTVATACLLILVLCGCGVAFIETSVRPAKFFSPQSEWIQDFRWLRERIGPMVSIEVVLCIDSQTGMTFLEQMELADQVARTVSTVDYIEATISAATFAPSLEEVSRDSTSKSSDGRTGNAALRTFGFGNQLAMRRRMLNKRLLHSRHVFVENRYLYLGENPDAEPGENAEPLRWRVTARATGSGEVDYDKVLEQVRQRVEGFLAQQNPHAEDVTPIYTGSAPLVFVAQRELLSGLFKSFCMAFALIAVVMVVLLRNVLAGLIVMLPNVFPALTTFGSMGWMANAVDVGAMMTASVALGIAVDDTLHFLTWFRRSILAGDSRQQAIVLAYQRCAPAMMQTTLIAGLAMMAFFMSSFQPVSQFGLLMFILLVAALVGDLLFLPALLATRMGGLFVGHSARDASARRENVS